MSPAYRIDIVMFGLCLYSFIAFTSFSEFVANTEADHDENNCCYASGNCLHKSLTAFVWPIEHVKRVDHEQR